MIAFFQAPWSKPKINGVPFPVRNQLRVTSDPQRGRIVIQDFSSAGDGLGGVATQCDQQGISYDWIISPVRSRLIATTTGAAAGVQNAVSDSWQMPTNEMQQSIKDNPTFAALGRVNIGLIQADADALQRNEDIDDSWYSYDPQGPLGAVLLDLLVKGQTHYGVGQYVLKHTANVSGDYTGLSSDYGVECIYTTAQLLGEIDSGWNPNCPARMQAKIGNIDLGGTFHTNYLWGWRKLPVPETSSANNRVDISFEYSFGEWSVRPLGLYSTL